MEQQELLKFILYFVIIIILVISLTRYVSITTTGKLVKGQVIAKQIALLLDGAEPGTIITLYHDKASIEKKENKISVKIGKATYSYDFFSPYDIKLDCKDNTTIIEINE